MGTAAETMQASAPRQRRVGELLRSWRLRRNLSQQALANGSAVSTRYLSFIETGRACPSREMVMHLAERLEVPLRDRNDLLFAAGYAPIYPERPLDSAEMLPVRRALERFLEAHEPYPALIVDRHWNLVAANRAVAILTEGVAPELFEPPANVFRIALHPNGMAPRILNLAEWSSYLLRRVQRQAAITGDRELELLYDELASYPGVDPDGPVSDPSDGILMHRLRLRGRELTFFSTVTSFGTATDITLAELAIEAFYPADDQSAALLRGSQPTRDTADAPPQSARNITH
jgi:transcriptional regulator with XRE-family HTH domain